MRSLQEEDVLRGDGDGEAVGGLEGLPGLLGKLHAEGRRVGLGPLRAEEDDGLKDIVDDPLHGAGDGIPLPLRRRADGVGADAHGSRLRRDGTAGVQGDAPVRQADEGALRLGGGEVLAAGEPGGGLRPRGVEELAHGLDWACLAALQHADVGAVAPGLAPVVGDPEDGAGEIVHDGGQLQLQLVLEVAVQGREGLVQEDHLGVRQQDPGQGAALLLPAGDLPGPEVRHGFQPEAAEGVLHQGVPVRFALEDGQEVPTDGHIGEEGVLLEEVARPALLGRQVDPGGAVEEDMAVQGDAALVGPEDAGDTAQRHALAAAGGAQQGQGLRPGLNGGLQPLGERVNEVRGLPGQIHCAAECRRFLEGSYLEHPDSKRALQDPLSFRCGAAINGSVYDSLEYVKNILELQINRTDDNPCILYEEGTTSVSPNFEVTTLSLGVDMLAAALCHMSHAITNRLYKIVDPGFTGLNRFLTPHEVKAIAFSTIQKTFAALDAENRWLANTTTLDITSFANGIEDHASNLPLAGMRSLRIVDNLRYMLGMELMHAAQAVEMRRDQRADNLLKLGKVTGPLKDAYRKTVPYYDADRNLSIDIEKSYQVIKDGSLLKVIEEAERA